MKSSIIFTVLCLMAGAWFRPVAAAPQPVREAHEWNVKRAKPCRIRVCDERNGCRTYYFDRDGRMRAVVAERYTESDREVPVSRYLYVITEEGEVLGKQGGEEVVGPGLTGIWKEFQSNNLARPAEDRFGIPRSDFVEMKSLKSDRRGDWILAENKWGKKFERAISAYGEDAAAVAETDSILTVSDSLAAEFRANAWTASDFHRYEKRHSPGFWRNVLFPVLLSVVLTGAVTLLLGARTRIPNLVIGLASALSVYAAAQAGITYYDYAGFGTVVFWFLAFFGFAITFKVAITGRCPKCGGWDSRVLGRRTVVRTLKEIAHHKDGRKEVLSSDTDVEETDTYRCAECGHRWNVTYHR